VGLMVLLLVLLVMCVSMTNATFLTTFQMGGGKWLVNLWAKPPGARVTKFTAVTNVTVVAASEPTPVLATSVAVTLNGKPLITHWVFAVNNGRSTVNVFEVGSFKLVQVATAAVAGSMLVLAADAATVCSVNVVLTNGTFGCIVFNQLQQGTLSLAGTWSHTAFPYNSAAVKFDSNLVPSILGAPKVDPVIGVAKANGSAEVAAFWSSTGLLYSVFPPQRTHVVAALAGVALWDATMTLDRFAMITVNEPVVDPKKGMTLTLDQFWGNTTSPQAVPTVYKWAWSLDVGPIGHQHRFMSLDGIHIICNDTLAFVSNNRTQSFLYTFDFEGDHMGHLDIDQPVVASKC